jgi:hypothetical protein
MTNEEFSNEFDVLYNSITSNQAPGLDEYEKSVFLTKAEKDLVREHFNPRVDGADGGFDGSQKRQYDFSMLIKTAQLDYLIEGDYPEVTKLTKLDNRSLLFKFPSDYFLSVNEVVVDEDANAILSVIPLSYQEYQRLMTKPYAYPPKRIAWRLFTGTITIEEDSTTYPVAEIIGKFISQKDNISYNLRYVKQPRPIVLIAFDDTDGVSIDGVKTKTECELPAQMHQEILERAVTLAKIAYQGGSTSTLAQQQSRNNQQQ